jgi:hypothetical protein
MADTPLHGALRHLHAWRQTQALAEGPGAASPHIGLRQVKPGATLDLRHCRSRPGNERVREGLPGLRELH